MIRRPPRSTQSRSSAASDVYKRQVYAALADIDVEHIAHHFPHPFEGQVLPCVEIADQPFYIAPVAYRGAHPFGEVGDSQAPTGALRPVGMVFRPNGLDRGYV